MFSNYAIDLTLQPTTFDLWHVCLAGALVLLVFIQLVLFIIRSVGGRDKAKQKPAPVVVAEKPTPAPAPKPEPVVLKEATPDAAFQLLGLLQKEARFIDFIKEEITAYSDADIGVAARVVHEGCNKAINEHFTLAPVRTELEGDRITLQPGFDAALVRLTGNVVGQAPFTGTLIHKGWQVSSCHLPKLASEYNAAILAAAEVEL